jgi:hypothetical protein
MVLSKDVPFDRGRTGREPMCCRHLNVLEEHRLEVSAEQGGTGFSTYPMRWTLSDLEELRAFDGWSEAPGGVGMTTKEVWSMGLPIAPSEPDDK